MTEEQAERLPNTLEDIKRTLQIISIKIDDVARKVGR